MFDVDSVKVQLKKKGWTHRAAGAAIGRSYQWVNHVLNGHEKSRPVLEALMALPKRPCKSPAKPARTECEASG